MVKRIAATRARGSGPGLEAGALGGAGASGRVGRDPRSPSCTAILTVAPYATPPLRLPVTLRKNPQGRESGWRSWLAIVTTRVGGPRRKTAPFIRPRQESSVCAHHRSPRRPRRSAPSSQPFQLSRLGYEFSVEPSLWVLGLARPASGHEEHGPCSGGNGSLGRNGYSRKMRDAGRREIAYFFVPTRGLNVLKHPLSPFHF